MTAATMFPAADPALAQAERAVLGAMMSGPAPLDRVLSTPLRSADFHTDRHATIYAAVVGLYGTGTDHPTPLHVTDYLAAHGELDRCGGAPYLLDCMQAYVGDPGYYTARVVDAARRRRLVEGCAGVVQRAQSPAISTDDLVASAEQLMWEASAGVPAAGAGPMTMGAGFAALWEVVTSPTAPDPGMSTGVGALDDVLGGLHRGRLVIVGGRPGMGKSILGVQCAVRAGLRGHGAAVFSAEMSSMEMMQRIVSARAGVNLARIIAGRLSQDDLARVARVRDEVTAAPVYVYDQAAPTLGQIRAGVQAVKRRGPLGLVVVDYIQLMRTSGRGANRAVEVGELSTGLKVLARDEDVCVVAMAQLNRGPEGRADRRPVLSDLRESGQLEADGDQVVFVHRPDAYDPRDRPGIAELIIPKNRHGRTDTVEASAQLHYARFVDITS